jgi:hypothetical protein
MKMLASALLKMAASPANKAVKLVDPTREYMQVTEAAWFWCKLPEHFPSIKLGLAVPKRGTTKLLLLAHIGDGDYGRVWLASSERGVACALKFPRHDAKVQSALSRELQVWRDVLGNPEAVRIQSFNGREALLMPYLHICSTTTNGDGAGQQPTSEVRAAACRAAVRMATGGWRHDDLKWSHVGLYRAEGGLEAFFVDLGMCTAVKGPDEQKSAVKAMKEALGLGDS